MSELIEHLRSFNRKTPQGAKPESTEEERASGCGWVLRCSWDNGF